MIYIILFLYIIYYFLNNIKILKIENFGDYYKPVILITQYYKPKWIERLNEINDCLKLNIKNKYITQIYLFMEKDYDINYLTNGNKKVQKKIISKRLNYKYVIDFANKYLNKYIVVLVNSDIYFNDTLKTLQTLNYNNTIYAITRYNENKYDSTKYKLQPYNNNSQDTWIWSGKVNIINNNFFRKDGVELGVFGCDNLIAGLFKKSNYKVINNCKQIITIHKHKNYDLRSNPTKKYGNMNDYHFVKCETFINIYHKKVVFLVEINNIDSIKKIKDLMFFNNFLKSFFESYKKDINYTFYLGYHSNNINYTVKKYKIIRYFYDNYACNKNINIWLFEIDPQLVIENELKKQLKNIKLNSYFHFNENFNFNKEWFNKNL